LRITGLKADSGPGIEFLEYLAPQTGRPYPVDSRANDLWHWQTRLHVRDVMELAEKLKSVNTPFVTPGVVVLPEREIGIQQGLLVRDPDGHALLLHQSDR